MGAVFSPNSDKMPGRQRAHPDTRLTRAAEYKAMSEAGYGQGLTSTPAGVELVYFQRGMRERKLESTLRVPPEKRVCLWEI